MTTVARYRPPEPPLLTTERLVLRLAAPRDAAAIVDYYDANRAHLAPYEPTRSPEFYTVDFWKRQASLNVDDFHADRALRLFLFHRDRPDEVIGNANFSNFVRGVAFYCTLGYGIAERCQGKGLMYEALDAAVDHVFYRLNMHRIMANYMPHNRRSGGLLRRLGFQVEGYSRDYLLINGRWEDHVLTARVNPEWRPSEW